MASVYRDSKYFKVGERYKNPLTNRLVKVGGRTFNKFYAEFGDEVLYKHMVEPQQAEFELLDKAFMYSDKSYEAKLGLITFEQFRTRCTNSIRATLVEELREMKGLKYFVSIKVQFSKVSMSQNERATTITTPFIRTKTIQALNEGEIVMDDIFTKLTENIAAYQREGS